MRDRHKHNLIYTSMMRDRHKHDLIHTIFFLIIKEDQKRLIL